MSNNKNQVQIWEEKKILAKKAADLIGRLPFVRAVILTGSVAYGDVKNNDDLDFLLITKENRVYITRFLVYMLAMILGKKRRVDKEKDALCFNIFLDETALVVPEKKRNNFAKLQLERMKVLIDKDEVVKKMREVNSFWTTKTQIKERDVCEEIFAEKQLVGQIETNKIGEIILDYLEKVMRFGQQKYMKKKITNEMVNDKQIFFHPREFS